MSWSVECVLHGSGVPVACAREAARGACHSFEMAGLETLSPLPAPPPPRPPAPRQACLHCTRSGLPTPPLGTDTFTQGDQLQLGVVVVTPVTIYPSTCPGTRTSVLGRAEGLSGSSPSLTGEEVQVHGPGHWASRGRSRTRTSS